MEFMCSKDPYVKGLVPRVVLLDGDIRGCLGHWGISLRGVGLWPF